MAEEKRSCPTCGRGTAEDKTDCTYCYEPDSSTSLNTKEDSEQHQLNHEKQFIHI
jgi:uncharacterized membrane protein YvbJ